MMNERLSDQVTSLTRSNEEMQEALLNTRRLMRRTVDDAQLSRQTIANLQKEIGETKSALEREKDSLRLSETKRVEDRAGFTERTHKSTLKMRECLEISSKFLIDQFHSFEVKAREKLVAIERRCNKIEILREKLRWKNELRNRQERSLTAKYIKVSEAYKRVGKSLEKEREQSKFYQHENRQVCKDLEELKSKLVVSKCERGSQTNLHKAQDLLALAAPDEVQEKLVKLHKRLREYRHQCRHLREKVDQLKGDDKGDSARGVLRQVKRLRGKIRSALEMHAKKGSWISQENQEEEWYNELIGKLDGVIAQLGKLKSMKHLEPYYESRESRHRSHMYRLKSRSPSKR
ncbi:hypothetical protein AAMO2058_000312700 [Amorphochlora amoebiformis]